MATKTISIDQLRTGMYVAKIDLSWFQSPFLRRSLLIEHTIQIEKLRRAGAQHIVIDLSRGDDVETSSTLDPPISSQAITLTPQTPPSKSIPKPLTQLNEEYAQALVARKQLEQAVHSVFSSISEQGSVDPQLAAEAVQEVSIVTRTLPNSAIFMALSQQRAGDSSLSRHALSTCTLALVVGQSFGYNPLELQELALAALLHDIGLLQIPAPIIQRSANTSSPLSVHDRRILESHPRLGILALERQGGFEAKVLQMIGEHHIRLDDSGYPQGTKGEFTSERSRILMIADYYDELITGFGGASPLAPHQALQRIFRESQDRAFDQVILSRFIKLIGIYPVHSRVQLNTKERAVVTELNPSALHRPVVTITHTPSGNETPNPLVIDLSDQANVTPERAIDRVLDSPEPAQPASSSQAA
jgi:HD-GYP domain-containing protein (c-di-GMP phosphodiesterase class II)